jgi:hypothetical protein
MRAGVQSRIAVPEPFDMKLAAFAVHEFFQVAMLKPVRLACAKAHPKCFSSCLPGSRLPRRRTLPGARTLEIRCFLQL